MRQEEQIHLEPDSQLALINPHICEEPSSCELESPLRASCTLNIWFTSSSKQEISIGDQNPSSPQRTSTNQAC